MYSVTDIVTKSFHIDLFIPCGNRNRGNVPENVLTNTSIQNPLVSHVIWETCVSNESSRAHARDRTRDRTNESKRQTHEDLATTRQCISIKRAWGSAKSVKALLNYTERPTALTYRYVWRLNHEAPQDRYRPSIKLYSRCTG